ncbi:hypothetical protein YC2023_045760 [Brassica napus]
MPAHYVLRRADMCRSHSLRTVSLNNGVIQGSLKIINHHPYFKWSYRHRQILSSRHTCMRRSEVRGREISWRRKSEIQVCRVRVRGDSLL